MTIQQRSARTDQDVIREVSNEPGLRRDIGSGQLLFIGVGGIIGSGWLFGALYAAQMAGPAAVVAWVIGAVISLFLGLVYGELGAMLPISGGIARYPHYAFGSLTSYIIGFVSWLALVSLAPIEVEAALQYSTNYIPWLTHVGSSGTPVLTAAGYGIAVALMALFCAVNMLGARAFARVNTPIAGWKILIIVLVIVAFIATSFRAGNFSSFGGFAPYGGAGIFSAVATAGISFSFEGFRHPIEMAGESRNPRRSVPLAVIGSIVITAVLYIVLQVAFVGSLSPSDLAHGWSKLSFANDFGPLAGIASILGLGWLAILLYIDAFVSPAGAGLEFTVVTPRVSYAMAHNGNVPSALGYLNRRGIPWVGMIVTFVVGILIFLPFPGWQKLVGFITSAMVLSFGSGAVSLAALRRQLPNAERPFRLPGGDVIPFLAFFASNLIVYWAGWETNWKLFVAVGLGLIVFAGYQWLHPAARHRLDWAASSWVFLLFVGLLIISALGSYGGGAGLIPASGWSFAVIFALSLGVYLAAVRFRLDRSHVIEHLMAAKTARHPGPTGQAGPLVPPAEL